LVETVRIITKVLAIKDPKLGTHVKRVTALSVSIAKDLEFSQEGMIDLEMAALLHDIGKVGMAEFILFKKDSLLTLEQKNILRRHPVIGNLSLAGIERLKKASEIILHHHENFDGSGYPYGLKGEAIPLGSRIISTADAFDNLASGVILGTRPIPAEEAIRDIKKESGSRFDPFAVASLIRVITGTAEKAKNRYKRRISLQDLRDGMILADPVVTESGIVLMLENEILNEGTVEKIREYAEIEPLYDDITVYEEK
jgi:response regulator RpfG family c-di-GMP phosphodiesterase